MTSSTKCLSKYLCQAEENQCRRPLMNFSTILGGAKQSHTSALHWSGSSCLAVASYVHKFFHGSDRDLIIKEILCDLDEAASVLSESPSHTADGRIQRSNKAVVNIKFTRLQTDFVLAEANWLFNVPKAEKLPEMDKLLDPNEILAGFLEFLLQILYSRSLDKLIKKRHILLRKELKFLLAYLGDTPFRCTSIDEVKTILEDFKQVANEVGNFIYRFIFPKSHFTASEFDTNLRPLLQSIEVLNEKIRGHCIRFTAYFRCVAPSIDNAVDYFFIVDSLIENLESINNCQSHLMHEHLQDQIKMLHDELITFSKNIPKGFKVFQEEDDSAELKESLVEIRDAVYEAEYLINSYVAHNVPLWYLNLRFPLVVGKIKMKTSGITFDGFQKTDETKIMKDYSQHTKNHDDVIGNVLVGFEDDMTRILTDLVGGSESLQIISIFGMPGLGKTTVAHNLFNSRSIYDYFDVCVWCVVTEAYGMRKMFIDILMNLPSRKGMQTISEMDNERLGLEIYQTLKGRRYLVVMDDIWPSTMWDDLRRYLPDDGNGSRILVTTRIKDASPKGSTFHTLPLLSEDGCWNLLVKKVFPNEQCPQQLLATSKEIAAKCHGLPLAVVVIAGILANLGKEESLWKKVERNLPSYTFNTPSDYRKVLELSFKHLPNHLQLCFLYMGTFPEDKEIHVRKLVWLWIAEGFIRKEKGKSPENVAEGYLSDLINRSLILIARRRSDGGIKSCRIHDLLREMCLKIAEEENFFKTVKGHSSIYVKHHRLGDHSTLGTYFSHFGLHCRSLSGNISDLSSCLRMPLLRVIEQFPSEDQFLPKHFMLASDHEATRTDVVHLRYMAINRMPSDTLRNFLNLEFLCITSTEKVHVPLILLNMVKLRHVRITRLAQMEHKGYTSSVTTNLETLSYFDFSNKDKLLRRSPHLRKLKCVFGERVFPDLCFLTKIECLGIRFDPSYEGGLTKINFPSSFKRLGIQPSINFTSTLEKLGIWSTKITFPSTLKRLNLSKSCFPWEEMSLIGTLPNLQVLKLEYRSFVGKEWHTRDGEFKELRFLKLELVDLKMWTTDSEHFPKLQCLVVNKCKEMLTIPSELGDIPTLERIEVRLCSFDASISAVRIEEEQRENGNDELNVIIQNHHWSKELLLRKCRDNNQPPIHEDTEDSDLASPTQN